MKRQLLLIVLALASFAPSIVLAYDGSASYTSAVCYDRWGNAYDCRYSDPYYRGSYYGPTYGTIGYGIWPHYYGHHHHHHDYAPHHGFGHDPHDYGHGMGHHGFGHGGYHGGHHGGHGH